MHRNEYKDTRENQGNMTSPREINKAAVMEPEELKIYNISNKEFRIMLKKCRESQENMYGKLRNCLGIKREI